MNTSEFLVAVLPPDGAHYFVIEATKSGAKKHLHVPDIPTASRYVSWRDSDPKASDSNVYFALASFKQASYENAKGKIQKRTQENADQLKCFWVDLDCKGRDGDYASQKDALKDIGRFMKEASFPRPSLMLNSGYGVHAYWILEDAIDASEWTQIAKSFRKLLDAHKVKHDPACTSDCARFLRPLGTHNRKEGKPDQEVTLFGSVHQAITLKEFTDPIGTITTMPTEQSGGEDMSLNAMAEGMVEFPPSSIKEIVKECGVLREVGMCGGSVSEPLWYATLGVVKFTVEAEKAIHAFSKGDVRYSSEATIAKAEQWEKGAATCEILKERSGELPDHCASCKHWGQIASPITLGYAKVLFTETVTRVDATEICEVTDIPAFPPEMQMKFKWEGEKLWRVVLDKEATKAQGSDVFDKVPFCDFLLYPHSYYNDILDKHHMVWRLREREGVYKEFDISGSSLGSGGVVLFKELGERGVVATNGGKQHMEAYILNHFANLRKSQLGVETYSHLGWHGKNFLLHNMLYKPDGSTEKVKLGGDLKTLEKYFVPTGSLEKWKKGINDVYNRSGNEQYQFIIGAGFGAPLMKFMNVAGGTTVSAHSTNTGQGKTTAARVAFGIYGSPAEDSKVTLSKSSATDMAIFNLAGVLHNLPLVVDEMTGVKGLDASKVVYTYSQGQPRQRSTQDGKIALTGFSWSGIMIATGNASLAGVIAGSKPSADAEIARMIEFRCVNRHRLSKEDADAVFHELNQHWGVAGPVFMAYVVAHLDEVIGTLHKTQRMLDKKFGFSAENRYWSAGYACAITGLFFAKKLGLVQFDIQKVVAWCHSQLLDMHTSIESITQTPDACFSSMLSTISQGLVITDIEGGRGSGGKQAYIERPPQGRYTGRLILDDNRGYLMQPVVHEWCSERQIDVKEMIDAAYALGWVTSIIAEKRYPGKGTLYPMGQCRCYTIDLLALENAAHAVPALAEVVKLVHKGGVK